MPEPEKGAIELNREAAAVALDAAQKWNAVTWLVVGMTVIGAIAWDAKRRRR